MYYNGNNKYRVNTFLNQVHTAMIAKYTNQAKEDAAKAAKLQSFFQELKNASKTYNPNDIVGNATINTILETIIQLSPANFKIENLFGQAGHTYAKNSYESGARFERELTRVIQAVYENLTDDEFEFDVSQVNIGSQTASAVNLSDELLNDKKVQKMLKTIGTKTQKYIETADGQKVLRYYLRDVDGKIDVKGYEINITGNPTAELLEIYDLLKDATFTAKNYNSMTWDEKAKIYVEAVGRNTLSLGKTNVYRAIVGTLGDLGFSERTAISAFWAGYNKINSGDDYVSTHFYHLRYIYELIGSGIKYNGVSFGTAKYLIFNDPSGGIWVKSTAEILSDLLNSSNITSSGTFGGTIVISKDVVMKD